MQISLHFKVIFVDKPLAPGDTTKTLCMVRAFFTGWAMDDNTVWAASIGNAVKKLAKCCPSCGGRDTRRSRTSWLERLLALLRLHPYRCRDCRCRFWRFG